MNQINAVTLGKLIAAHREGDEQKFKTYVDFIAKAYGLSTEGRTVRIIYRQVPKCQDGRRRLHHYFSS